MKTSPSQLSYPIRFRCPGYFWGCCLGLSTMMLAGLCFLNASDASMVLSVAPLAILPLTLAPLRSTLFEAPVGKTAFHSGNHKGKVLKAVFRLLLLVAIFSIPILSLYLDREVNPLITVLLTLAITSYLNMAALAVTVRDETRAILPTLILPALAKAPANFWSATLLTLLQVAGFSCIVSLIRIDLPILIPAAPIVVLSCCVVYLALLSGRHLGACYLEPDQKLSKSLKVPVTALIQETKANIQPRHFHRAKLNCPQCQASFLQVGIRYEQVHPIAKFINNHGFTFYFIAGTVLAAIGLVSIDRDAGDLGRYDPIWAPVGLFFVPFLIGRAVLFVLPTKRIIDCPKCGFYRQESI